VVQGVRCFGLVAGGRRTPPSRFPRPPLGKLRLAFLTRPYYRYDGDARV